MSNVFIHTTHKVASSSSSSSSDCRCIVQPVVQYHKYLLISERQEKREREATFLVDVFFCRLAGVVRTSSPAATRSDISLFKLHYIFQQFSFLIWTRRKFWLSWPWVWNRHLVIASHKIQRDQYSYIHWTFWYISGDRPFYLSWPQHGSSVSVNKRPHHMASYLFSIGMNEAEHPPFGTFCLALSFEACSLAFAAARFIWSADIPVSRTSWARLLSSADDFLSWQISTMIGHFR